MPSFRVTIRYGDVRPHYEILDVEASDLRAALTEAAHRIPDPVAATAELAEIRRQVADEDRHYTPE